MRAFRSMFVPNAQLRTRGEALRHAQRLGLYSSLRIPIVIGAQFERILALQWEREIPEPAPSVIAVMRRFADQAGLAMEQAERRRAQEETRELQAVTEALAAAATPSDVGLAIVRQGVKALERARRHRLRADARTGQASISSRARGTRAETMSAWEQIPLEVADAAHRRMRSGEIIVCASPEEIARAVPVVRRQRPVVRRRAAHRSGPRDRRHLHRLGRGAPVRRQPEPDRQPRPAGGPGARPRPAVRA